MNFGRAFDAAQDSPDARAAYAVAEKIARMNLAKDPSDKSLARQSGRRREGLGRGGRAFG